MTFGHFHTDRTHITYGSGIAAGFKNQNKQTQFLNIVWLWRRKEQTEIMEKKLKSQGKRNLIKDQKKNWRQKLPLHISHCEVA